MTDQTAPAAVPDAAPTPAPAEAPAAGAPPVEGAAPAGADPAAPAADPAPAPAPNVDRDPVTGQYKPSEASRLREDLARAQGQLDAIQRFGLQPRPAAAAPPPPAPPPAPVAPDPTKYAHGEFDPRYTADLTKYEMRLELQQEQEAAATRARQAAAQSEFNQRRDSFLQTRDTIDALGEDFAPAKLLLRSDQLDIPTADAIVATENPAYVAAYYAARPDEFTALKTLSPLKRAVAIGKVDAQIGVRLTELRAAPPAPAAQPAPATPTPRVIGNGPAGSPSFDAKAASPAAVSARLADLKKQRAEQGGGWSGVAIRH